MSSSKRSTRPAPETPFSASKIVSSSLKSVLLDDWWLAKTQATNALGVQGLTAPPRTRDFSSTPVSKRHTATTLETIDGIVVTLCGSINISRTRENGFPPEVYSRYLHGFPFDWEEHAAGLLGQGSTDKSASAGVSSRKYMSSEHSGTNQLPFSIDDVPVTVTRDFIASRVGDPEQLKTIFYDILKTLGEDVIEDTTPQDSRTGDSDPNESPTMAKKVCTDCDKSKSADLQTEGSHNSKKGKYSGRKADKKCVPTRSSTRIKNKKKIT